MPTKNKSNWLARFLVVPAAQLAFTLAVFLAALPSAQIMAQEETIKQQDNVPSSPPKVEVQKPVSKTSNEMFVVVEKMPEFPGGEKARMKYLKENINYPEEAKQQGIQGTVYVTFIIEPDGRITEVKLLRGIGGGCDEEAVRVIENMPKWKPGEIKGEIIRKQFTMPIRFSPEGKTKSNIKKRK
jgi:TonB family protein